MIIGQQRELRQIIQSILLAQQVGKLDQMTIRSTMWTTNSTRSKALVHPNVTARIFPPPSLTAFRATSTAPYSSGGEWAMETNGGIWPTATVWTENAATTTGSNHRPILHRAQGGQPTTKPKAWSLLRRWGTLETHFPTITSALVNT